MKSTAILCLAALSIAAASAGTHITSGKSHAWSPTSGWIDLRAGDGALGVRVGPTACAGFAWSATCGWINFGDGRPADCVRYSNASGSDSGVNRMDDGGLRGLAWSATTGWINFEATGNPRIDPATRQILGHAWSPAMGWIAFDTPQTDLVLIDIDTDKDGIPDVWELQHAETLIPLGAGDADHDGSPDAQEYAAGTDPFDPSSFLRITEYQPDRAPGPALGWTSVSARSYRIESSADLKTWNTALLYGNIPATLISGSQDSTSRYLAKPTATRQFYRVSVYPPAAGE